MENIGATRIEDVPVLDTRERLKADPIAVVVDDLRAPIERSSVS